MVVGNVPHNKNKGIQMFKFNQVTFGNMIFIFSTLFIIQEVQSKPACGENAIEERCMIGGSISSRISNSSSSLDRTEQVINAITPALQQWAANMDAQRRKDEEESKKRQAEYEAKKKADQDNFNQYVNQAKDDPSTNPWANASTNREKEEKRLDVNLGYCVEQNFSRQSNGKFALRNSCNFAINLKYTFSISKTFSGTYTTLRPNEMTFETGKENEKIKFMMCPVPKVPQTLDGGCI